MLSDDAKMELTQRSWINGLTVLWCQLTRDGTKSVVQI
jgi:hypothetical protein